MNVLRVKNILQFKIALILVLFVNNGYAQTNDASDFSTWSSIKAVYKLNQKWDFGLEGQLRLKENASVIDQYFTQLTAEYELLNNFQLGGGIRYIMENDNQGKIQGYENHFRFHFDAKYKHKVNKFSLGYRVRYNNKDEIEVSNEDGDYAKQNIRFKTSVGYNIKGWKLDPKFSAEIFNRFAKNENSRFNKYRLTLGTTYKIKNIGKFRFYYRLEKELNVDLPETTNIIGLKFIYTFKNKTL